MNGRFVHLSKRPLIAIHDCQQTGTPNHKPLGLWFSVESDRQDGWIDWCKDNAWRDPDEAFHTELDVDMSRMLLISSANELDLFHAEYAANPWPPYPQWNKVADQWDGIVIAPYIVERRFEGDASRWYYGWDCASGCVWDASAVKLLNESKCLERLHETHHRDRS